MDVRNALRLEESWWEEDEPIPSIFWKRYLWFEGEGGCKISAPAEVGGVGMEVGEEDKEGKDGKENWD